MADKYFVLTVSEDGDVYINNFSKEQLEKELNEEEWGPAPQMLTFGSGSTNLENVPAGIFIIKGEAVRPNPVTVTTKWSV